MQNKYTASLVGCGRIGWTLGYDKLREQPASHTMALNANKRIQLIAGCDTDEDALQKWGKANKGCKLFLSAQKLFSECKTDIVTVAVNEDAHIKIALEAIKNKPRLLILEKPVALNTEEALQLKNAAEENRVPVLVNHERRFALDYNLAAEYLTQIGEIQSINASLYSGMKVYDKSEEATGAYSLIHDGTHLVDIVLFFLEALQKNEKLNEGKAILSSPSVSGIWRDQKGSVRNVSASYSLPSVPCVTINISGRSKYFGFEVDIRGTKGRILIGNGFFNIYMSKESKLYTGFKSLEEIKFKRPKKTLYFANMIQNAVDFLDGKAELRSTLQTGMNALAVLEEIKMALM